MRVILCAVALVALTRACVREGPKDDRHDKTHGHKDGDGHQDGHKKRETKKMNRVLFALSDDIPGFSSIDEESGMVVGLAKDMIDRACGACKENLQCDTVWIGNNYGRCWDDETLTGEGLMNYHYHACVGWVPTTHRTNTFNFSSPMIHAQMGAVYTRPDVDVTDTEAMMTRVVGVRKYYFLDQRCIRKYLQEGQMLPDSNVKIIPTDSWAEMREKLDNDEIQFVMLPSGNPASEGLVMVGEPMQCTKEMGGKGLVYRKDIDFKWFEMCTWMGMMSQDGDPMGKHGEYRRMCQKWGLEDMCYTDAELDVWDAEMKMAMMEKEKEMSENGDKDDHMDGEKKMSDW